MRYCYALIFVFILLISNNSAFGKTAYTTKYSTKSQSTASSSPEEAFSPEKLFLTQVIKCKLLFHPEVSLLNYQHSDKHRYTKVSVISNYIYPHYHYLNKLLFPKHFFW